MLYVGSLLRKSMGYCGYVKRMRSRQLAWLKNNTENKVGLKKSFSITDLKLLGLRNYWS